MGTVYVPSIVRDMLLTNLLSHHVYRFEGPQVRLLLNGETFPLSICEESYDDSEYGTCSLDNFVFANAYSLDVEYHDSLWNATCVHD